ncbi:MAG: DNA repair protein RecN [Rhodoluna sp.]|nr:DNA repair protein RecN [Rhodoluna sp.]
MIEEIFIRDLGVIREARLKFGKGLTVITGETGAGKTMVLSALGLLLGERADSTAIRQGSQEAFVEGRWQLDGDSLVFTRVSEAGATASDNELILNRSVSSEGRSRAAVGGRAVPVALLSELSDMLVVVHGQSDQIRLKSSVAQREAIDIFGGKDLEVKVGAYRQTFFAWKTAQEKLAALRNNVATREAEAAALRLAVEEFDRIDPQPGELDEVVSKSARLTHTEELRQAVAKAHEALSSEVDAPEAVGLVGQARRALEGVSQHDPVLAEQVENLQRLGYELVDAAAALSGYLESLEGGTAQELEALQQRRAELNSLTRRYGTYEEVLEYREQAQQKLFELDPPVGAEQELIDAVQKEFDDMERMAGQITGMRESAARRLEEEVTAELGGLAMPGASLVVSVTDSGDFMEFGRDSVSILLSAYPGAEPRPLGKGASGGELSRIMLAIEVVLAKTHPVPTFIFDEVDAGVGGGAAIEVGRRLATLAKDAQVIVVTHLAQVAAYADRHLRVMKSSNAEYTASDVVSLTGGDRIEELARMLSGLSDSGSARVHAHELLVRASSEFGAAN